MSLHNAYINWDITNNEKQCSQDVDINTNKKSSKSLIQSENENNQIPMSLNNASSNVNY